MVSSSSTVARMLSSGFVCWQSSGFVFGSIRFLSRQLGTSSGVALKLVRCSRPQRSFGLYIGVKKDLRVLALARQVEARICVRRPNTLPLHSGSKVQQTFQVISQLIACQYGVQSRDEDVSRALRMYDIFMCL